MSEIEVVRTRGLDLEKAADIAGAISNMVHRLFQGCDQAYNPVREHLFFPDTQIGHLPTLFKNASALIQERKIEYVYVSCSPFSFAFLIPWLKKKFPNIKAILDFRDAWQFNPHSNRSKGHQVRVAKAEKTVLQHVDLFVANTPGMAKLYSHTYPDLNISTIPNGYDFSNCKKNKSKKFVIMHTGNFYKSRTPECLLNALETINEPMEFWQVGSTLDYRIDNPKITFRQYKTVARNEVLDMLQKSSLLYLKQANEGPDVTHIAVAAKTYEYLASGVPILADVPEGDNSELIRNYGNDSYLCTRNEPGEIATSISAAHAIWSRNKCNYKIDENFLRDFSRKKLAEQLLNSIMEL